MKIIKDDENPKMDAEMPKIGMMEKKPKNVPFGNKNVKIEKPEVDKNAEFEKTAKTNFRTLVNAMTKFYSENFNLEENEIEDIIKNVDNWEWKLGNCETESGDTLQTLNDDLRNFLLENQSVIQEGLNKAIADK
ncbi:MAG: hypothetical protein IKP00_03450 [Victivallales bacterium]|nr:hypothetical protein [Victivallales bacterium]